MTAAVIDADERLSTAPLPGGGKPLVLALIVSILLHLLLLFLWVGAERRDPPVPEPELVAIPMEFVAPPAPPPASAPPPAPPRAATPTPAPQVAPPPPPPLPPQLETATPAERSSSPTPDARPDVVPPIDRRAAPAPAPAPAPREAATPEPPAAAEAPPVPTSPDGLAPPPPALVPRRPAPATPAPQAQRPAPTQAEAKPTVGGGVPSEKVTQAETDFLLAQILRNWLLDYSSPRFAKYQIEFNFVLEPDGMLRAPMNAREPLDYRAVIGGYDTIVAAAERDPSAREARSLLESFVVAVRAAQPFRMQPGAPPVTQPRQLEIRFVMGDLPPRR